MSAPYTKLYTHERLTDLEFINVYRRLSSAVPPSRMLYIESPLITDVFPIFFTDKNINVLRITGQTDSGTIRFEVQRRSVFGPNVEGTQLGGLTANSVGVILNKNIQCVGDAWLYYKANDLTGTPTRMWVTVSYAYSG